MSNPSLLTYCAKVSTVEEDYLIPSATLAGLPFEKIYCFIGSVDPWPTANVPTPSQDQYSIKTVQRNIFAAKLVTSSDISPVAQRFDWTSGTVYDYYLDTMNMFELDSHGNLVNQFYVRNRYNQVFKCLWNNNGAPSLNEPYFQPGSYNTNNIYQGPDGYKWKFIYTISDGDIVTFMDSNWIPVPVGKNTLNPLLSDVGTGSVDVINVTYGGYGYDSINTVITITVTGDGTGATATVGSIIDGVIQDIIVTSPGQNYTYANVAITPSISGIGAGATAIAPVSPVGGHGFDPVSELGCNHVMHSVQFNGGEYTNGIKMVPTDITYYQVGLLVNPIAQSTSPYPANASIYMTSTSLVVAQGFGGYISDEYVYQGTSLSTASYVAKVVNFDLANDVIYVINTVGSPTYNAPVFGNSSLTARTLLTVNEPDFVAESGYVSYIENLPGIQRSPDGIEQFKIVLGY